MAPEGDLASLQQYCRELEARCAEMKGRIQALEQAVSKAEAERARLLQAQLDLLRSLVIDLGRHASEPRTSTAIGRGLRRLLWPLIDDPGEISEVQRTVEELRRLAQTLISGTSC